MKFSTSFSVGKTLYVYMYVCVSSSVRGNGKKKLHRALNATRFIITCRTFYPMTELD